MHDTNDVLYPEITDRATGAEPSETGRMQDARVEDLLQLCDKLSPYELYRLRAAMTSMLEDPKRVRAVKREVAIGDEIEYFDPVTNRLVQAVVLEHSRKRLVVRNLCNGECWRIEYASVKTDSDDFVRPKPRQQALGRDDFSVGEKVGFRDRQEQECVGTIIRLNRKTVTIDGDDGRQWRVAYSLLSRVIDTNASDGNQQLLIDRR